MRYRSCHCRKERKENCGDFILSSCKVEIATRIL
uniref:Uncharacterized protein n=1 Tax=Rhizophora mucronata TaxID=61149 RepID=A0A2P2PQL0_RHIMU